jgi:putative hemolysin
MSAIAFEIVVVLLLLVINGVFAMSELAVVSARRLRLEHRAEAGDAGARAALELAREPSEFLSAVQVGITLVGVLSGAFGGATLSEEVAVLLAGVPAVARWAEPLAFGLVVAAISYLSLIVGELVPKRIALANPERIAARVARPMRLVARIGRPLVRLLTGSTNLVLRILGVRGSAEPSITEEEIRALVEQGAESGVVQPAEQELVESVFRLGDRHVATIMTPRPDIDWLDLEDEPERLRERLGERLHGRLVVCRGDVDHVVGIVHTDALLARTLTGAPLVLPDDLRALVNPPLFVPGSMPAFRLLEELRRAREHVALVVDEFGGIEGIVTLADILSALVGDMPTREQEDEPTIVRRADGSWLVDGTLPLEDLEVELDIDPLPAEERRGFRTVAGFVVSRLGRVARVGDTIDWGALRVEVVDMDGRRIDKLLVATRASDLPLTVDEP